MVTKDFHKDRKIQKYNILHLGTLFTPCVPSG